MQALRQFAFRAFRCFPPCFSLCFPLSGLKTPESTESKKQSFPTGIGAAELAHGRMATTTKEHHMTDDRIRLADWNRPTTITISTPNVPRTVNARPAISHPNVQRRVMHPDGLDWHGTVYPQGSVVTLTSDRAYPLELSGHLARLDGYP